MYDTEQTEIITSYDATCHECYWKINGKNLKDTYHIGAMADNHAADTKHFVIVTVTYSRTIGPKRSGSAEPSETALTIVQAHEADPS